MSETKVPWVGPVRVFRRPDGWSELVASADDHRLLATCVLSEVADAIAARLNAEPGCGCRAVVEAEAECLRECGIGARHLSDVARRLPAPAAPSGDVQALAAERDRLISMWRERCIDLRDGCDKATADRDQWRERCESAQAECRRLRAQVAGAWAAAAWHHRVAPAWATPIEWGRELWLACALCALAGPVAGLLG